MVQYGSNPLNASFCEEAAIRILVGYISRSANSGSTRHIHPLLCFSESFSVTLIFSVFDGVECGDVCCEVDVKAKKSDQNAVISACVCCGFHETKDMVNSEHFAATKKDKTVTDSSVKVESKVKSLCSLCGNRSVDVGPLWMAPILSSWFVIAVHSRVELMRSNYGSAGAVQIMSLLLKEVDSQPLFVSPKIVATAIGLDRESVWRDSVVEKLSDRCVIVWRFV